MADINQTASRTHGNHLAIAKWHMRPNPLFLGDISEIVGRYLYNVFDGNSKNEPSNAYAI